MLETTQTSRLNSLQSSTSLVVMPHSMPFTTRPLYSRLATLSSTSVVNSGYTLPSGPSRCLILDPIPFFILTTDMVILHSGLNASCVTSILTLSPSPSPYQFLRTHILFMDILMMFFFEKIMYICNYMVLFSQKLVEQCRGLPD
jgi:hypothetical protein